MLQTISESHATSERLRSSEMYCVEEPKISLETLIVFAGNVQHVTFVPAINQYEIDVLAPTTHQDKCDLPKSDFLPKFK